MHFILKIVRDVEGKSSSDGIALPPVCVMAFFYYDDDDGSLN